MKFITKSLCAIGAVALMASCSKSTDLLDQSEIDAQKVEIEKNKIELAKLAYSNKFVQTYGEVAPDQSWDLTSGAKLVTRGANVDNSAQGYSEINTTLVDGLDFWFAKNSPDRDYWPYYFKNPNSLYNGITSVLPDGKKHSGQPVVLAAPTSDFFIFPVTVQGLWTHDLKIKVGNNAPVTLYSKTWTDYSKPYYNEISSNVKLKGIHIEAPIGTPIEVYIDNVKQGTTAKPSVGTFNGQAIYVSPKSGTQIYPGFKMKENAVIKFIGIEDNTSSNTDNDFNDVTLVVVGNPDVPEEIIVENEEYEVKSNICKRYMVEDLGSVDDFDFNDIVVDVYQDVTQKWKRQIINGEVISNEYVSTTYGDQEAIVRAMGGTLDFTITIGSTKWTKSSSFVSKTMYNTQGGYNASEVLAKFKVQGWDPQANNISIEVVKTVENTTNNENIVYTIPFPKKGEIPMIVAVDATDAWNWMTERTNIPAWWISEDETVTEEPKIDPVEE